MRATRFGLLTAMAVMAASLVMGGGTASAEPSGATSGTASEVDKNADNNQAQSTTGQSEQPNAMDQSANQQGQQQEKASQSDLDQGKTAQAVEELEQQKPSN